ncbi:hypothetical protein EI94DRAFT_1711516 [Lactarius quietus]|nr:hypothetical protein EI94DRAFT_1711516 [Lactarius quietus]
MSQLFGFVACTLITRLQIAQYSANANVRATELDWEDYDFIGDIVWVYAYIHATSTASARDSNSATFNLDAFQYTYAFRSQQIFPIHALILDSPHYKAKKPIPANNSYVGIGGRLTRISLTTGESGNCFYVNVDNVTFLG